MLCLWDHLRMIILLDRSWKPQCLFTKVESGHGLKSLEGKDSCKKLWCNCLTQAVSWTPQCFLNLHWPLRRSSILPTQMVLVESSLLPWVHSQWKDPATLRHAPLMHGLDSHSLISETQASTHLRSELIHYHCLTHTTFCYCVCVCVCSPSQVSDSGLKTNPLGQKHV